MFCVIRVNAYPQLGNGHLMRCLTVARVAKMHDLKPILVLSDEPGVPMGFIEAAACEFHLVPSVSELQDAELFCAFLASLNAPCWVVVDVYAFSAPWHERVYSHCQQLLVIDDLANRRYFCDVLLDHTPGRNAQEYLSCVNTAAQLFLGCEHALLAPEFFAAAEAARQLRKDFYVQKYLPKLLVSLGGTDPQGLSLVWFDLLVNHACEFGGITFLLASNAQVIPALSEKIAGHNQLLGSVRLVVDAHNMPQLLLDHDVVVGGAGVSALERAVLGLPSLMLILADNQLKQAQALNQSGCVLDLGNWQQLPDTSVQQAAIEQLMQLRHNYSLYQALSERAFNLVPSEQQYSALTHFFTTSRAGTGL
jgi:UDP-2,4-diacetamido-2,4,6-trideoxy-beta-L-altropyranose hydrolase